MARCSRHGLIFALVALLSPTAAWAHFCGPKEITVEKGYSTIYSIAGRDKLSRYEIVDKGDPLVAKIELTRRWPHVPSWLKWLVKTGDRHLMFKITGTGGGTTTFKIYWQGPRGEETCPVKVTVSG